MKSILRIGIIICLVLIISKCDKTLTDKSGKEICLNDYIASLGLDRSKIEAEAKSRGIDASAWILEIYKESTAVSNVIFDCTASEYYSKWSDTTSGKFIKAASPAKAAKEIENYTGSLTQDSIDLVFLIDATGSMRNNIEAVKNQLDSIIISLKGKQVSISIAFYRDKNVDSVWYARNPNDLIKADSKEISEFLGAIKAQGGGDLPESLFDAAYKTVSELNWTAKGRVLIVLTDAPPLTGDKTHYTNDEVINICLAKKVVPLVILVSLT